MKKYRERFARAEDAVRVRVKRVSTRVGRRGAVLICFALGWFFIGLSVELMPQMGVPLSILPVWVRAGIWWVSAVVAFCYAFVPRWRSDAPGFVALYIPTALRVVSYFVAWLEFLRNPEDGLELGWLACIIFLIFTGLIIIISGWREDRTQDLLEQAEGEPSS